MAANNEPESSDSLRVFGALVKAFRERAGLTQESFAPKVGYSVPTVASIEQGRRFPQRDFIDQAEEVLEAFGALRGPAKFLCRKAGMASWFREWAHLETMALNLWTYECRIVPGLLQPESYARAACHSNVPPLSDAQVDEQLALLAERQQLLHERPNTSYSFIIEEALLRRRTGGTAVTRDLVDHLLQCVTLRNVEVQIMPLVKERHAGFVGPLQLLETPTHEWMAYSEGPRGGHLFTSQNEVNEMLQVYATLRSQALTPEDSKSLLERLRGEL